jgi:23S rRNA (guanosine2251-2'-O)-methyltransferase
MKPSYNNHKKPGPPKEDFLFGLHPVKEAILAGKTIDKILIDRVETGTVTKEITLLCKEHNIPLQTVPPEKLQRITMKNHQGIIALLSPVPFLNLDNILMDTFEKGEEPLIVVLDRITDVRNMGAIARSCECMGVHAIVIPEKNASRINQEAVKSSAGALLHIPLCREVDLKQTIIKLKNYGLRIAGVTEKGADYAYKCDLEGPLALVMGSEEDGISDDIIRICDYLIQIPMSGKISSLNVSVATGIVLYEVTKQRRLA